MEDYVFKTPVTSQTDDRADLRAFRREVKAKTPDELRVLYQEEHTAFHDMLGREREGKAEIHRSVRTFKGYLLAFGPKPDPSCTLDRRNNDDPEYARGKCRWATPKEQARNRSTTNKLTDLDGRTMTLPEWAEETGTPAATMRQRLVRKWLDHEVIHGRGADRAVVADAAPAHHAAPGWPADLPHAHKWEQAYTKFENAFSTLGPVSRPLMLAWHLQRHLIQHEDALGEHDPGEEDRAGRVLLRLRRLMAWARASMTDADRRFIDRLNTIPGRQADPEDKEEVVRVRRLQRAWASIRAALPTPPPPAAPSSQPPPPLTPAERVAAHHAREAAKVAAGLEHLRVRTIRPLVLTPAQIAAASAQETAMVIVREREEDRLADLPERIARGLAADAMGIPRFEDRDAPWPIGLIIVPDPDDHDVIRRRPVPANDHDEAED